MQRGHSIREDVRYKKQLDSVETDIGSVDSFHAKSSINRDLEFIPVGSNDRNIKIISHCFQIYICVIIILHQIRGMYSVSFFIMSQPSQQLPELIRPQIRIITITTTMFLNGSCNQNSK